MGFGRRRGRRFKEKISLYQKGCICKRMAMGKNEPRQAHHASMGTFLSDRGNVKIALENLVYIMSGLM